MVGPAAKRQAVRFLVTERGYPERAACRALELGRSTYRYHPEVPDRDQRLVEEMKKLRKKYPRYGYRRIHQELRRRGWRDGRQRVARLWRQEGFQVPARQHKRARVGFSTGTRQEASHPNHVWSWDIIEDQLADARRLRILCVIDEYTKEPLSIYVGHHITSARVLEVLQVLMAQRGTPEHIRSDNGSEFIAGVVQCWFEKNEVKTIYITPGSPWENPYIESFNSRFRDELLNRELFTSLAEARVIIEDWRKEYLHVRPHSALGYLSPAEFAARCAAAGNKVGLDSLAGGPVPQTPWDLPHEGLPAGDRSGQCPQSTIINPGARAESNEAALSKLMGTEQRQGSLAAPPACRISTDRGAQVASPQSPILRAGNDTDPTPQERKQASSDEPEKLTCRD